MRPLIGIDLGTTNSLCAVFEDGGPRLLPNALGRVLTPSAVGILDDGRVVVGAAALELQVLRPDRACSAFKRWMGTDRTVELGGRRFTAPELSSLVLRSLKEDAESALGRAVDEAVVTVPAYFNELQRKATRVAGQLAGLDVRRIVNEPSAAALTYGLLDPGADKKLLVFDLGGGTFDVTLMEVFEGTLEIVATAGESLLGGEDFTDRIVHWALGEQGLHTEHVEMQEPLRHARLRLFAESAKRALSSAERATVRVPDAAGTVGDDAPILELTRARYAELVRPLLDRLTRPLARVLRDGRTAASDVDQVVLAGGATRDRLVHDLVRDWFEREPLCSVDPDEVVARGAAVQAALLGEHDAVEDVVVTDVCPFTLGVEVVKHFGRQVRDGYFLPIIHRNTTIPVSREEIVSTVQPGQREILVRVYQGEARRVEENLLLGELKVSGIPHGPAGREIALRFTYDVNGLLEVEAIVEETGARFSTVFTHHVSNLSTKEIDKAVKELQRLKFFPRDDLENRRLLLFAERVLGQVAPHERAGLEAALDGYESALHAGDRELFGDARRTLLVSLSASGHPDDEAGG